MVSDGDGPRGLPQSRRRLAIRNRSDAGYRTVRPGSLGQPGCAGRRSPRRWPDGAWTTGAVRSSPGLGDVGAIYWSWVGMPAWQVAEQIPPPTHPDEPALPRPRPRETKGWIAWGSDGPPADPRFPPPLEDVVAIAVGYSGESTEPPPELVQAHGGDIRRSSPSRAAATTRRRARRNCGAWTRSSTRSSWPGGTR